MLARIWRTQVDATRLAEYDHFAQSQSLPMFQQQSGFLGVLFLRSYQDCKVISLWENESAVAALTTSTTYQSTVRQLQETGLLLGQQQVQLFEVSGGTIAPELSFS